MAFAHRARTIGDVAQSLDIPMLAAWRLTRRAVALGLLEERGEQPRRGRASKLYQAIAPTFVIPDELMPRVPGEILADELRERLREEMARHGSSHLLGAGPDDEPLLTPLPAEAGGAVPFEAWRILRLDRTTAAALESDLVDVLNRYESLQHPAARPYLLHAAMVTRRV